MEKAYMEEEHLNRLLEALAISKRLDELLKSVEEENNRLLRLAVAVIGESNRRELEGLMQ
jgi:hypothetical protein|uniref:Uncharacterized protein n=1 Tax=Myoviridae sp. ct8Uw4 TaxID=2825040 RepID=A0A8S5P2P2_9CAUD|nr:MAG TPA: hypothetical protein [Myoviridae sp. ct8Uw4]